MSKIYLEKVFKVLGNRRRLMILDVLKEKGFASVSEISEHLKISFKATSRHLQILSSVQLIERTQEGTYMYYFLRVEIPSIGNDSVVIPYSPDKGVY